MPILIASLLALLGFAGLVEYRKLHPSAAGPQALPPAPPPTAPPVPPNAPPAQVVQNEAPALATEILDLLTNGKNPQLLDAIADELEKEGFFDSAALLHKQAAELRVQGPQGPVPFRPTAPGAFPTQSPGRAAPPPNVNFPFARGGA